MTDFDPGPGWRELDMPVPFNDDRMYLRLGKPNAIPERVWAREEPVPPLPNIPYTVIRVTWTDDGRRPTNEVAFFGGDWVDVDGKAFTPLQLQDNITGFEVLAEPRAVTARAVLDRVRERLHPTSSGAAVLAEIAREFEEGQP